MQLLNNSDYVHHRRRELERLRKAKLKKQRDRAAIERENKSRYNTDGITLVDDRKNSLQQWYGSARKSMSNKVIVPPVRSEPKPEEIEQKLDKLYLQMTQPKAEEPQVETLLAEIPAEPMPHVTEPEPESQPYPEEQLGFPDQNVQEQEIEENISGQEFSEPEVMTDIPTSTKKQPIKYFLHKTGLIKYIEKLPRSSYALVALAVFIFTTGMFMTIASINTNKEIVEEITSGEVAGSTDNGTDLGPLPGQDDPREVAPTYEQFVNYNVAPDAPRYIRINKIGVNARVIEVGKDTEGAIGVPPSIYDAGWYNGSYKPGQGGITVIDGHVSGWTSPGIFKDLHNLENGDEIEVELGNGEVYRYEVKEKEQTNVAQLNMDKVLRSIDETKEGLNLITCGGSFDYSSTSYNDRVVVYTTLKE